MRAQLAPSLEPINTQIALVSGHLDIWWVKRDEQKTFYANKLSYEDVKKKKKYQNVVYVHYLESPVSKILLERVLNDSPSIRTHTMLLEIIFGIDGGWFLMPLLATITRSPCIF